MDEKMIRSIVWSTQTTCNMLSQDAFTYLFSQKPEQRKQLAEQMIQKADELKADAACLLREAENGYLPDRGIPFWEA